MLQLHLQFILILVVDIMIYLDTLLLGFIFSSVQQGSSVYAFKLPCDKGSYSTLFESSVV